MSPSRIPNSAKTAVSRLPLRVMEPSDVFTGLPTRRGEAALLADPAPGVILACGRPAEPRVRVHLKKERSSGATGRLPDARRRRYTCRAPTAWPLTAAGGDSEELSLLRIFGCTEFGASVSGMRFGSAGPTAFNGMLVGIALAVLTFMFGGDGAPSVERMPQPVFVETMAW
jgi:hypothetical protein